ncbi:LLM class F420-dependent oxidoreductase [Micromonospora sp. NBC_01699]|nr:LLM class F420-dependent oxidoreductase [Micromonospora sp. NBC_01699]
MRYGVTLPLPGVPPYAHRRIVEELPDLGYTDVWTGEAAGADGFVPLALAAAWAPELHLGTAVVPVQTRGPALLAMTAATLAGAAPGGFTLGIGSSGPPFVTATNGIPFERPYQRVRDTLRFLRAAFAGEYVAGDFGSFRIEGFQLAALPHPPPRLIVGALRPGMLGLAGREADGAATNFLAVEDVPAVVAALGGGELMARLFVCPTRDVTYARAVGRRLLAPILNARTYSAFHDWLGRGERLAPVRAAWAVGDRAGAQAAIPDDIVDALLVHGSPQECAAHVARYVAAGIDVPALALVPAPEFGGGPEAAREMVRRLSPARVGVS